MRLRSSMAVAISELDADVVGGSSVQAVRQWGSSVALAEPNTPTWVGGCLEWRRLAVQILTRARPSVQCQPAKTTHCI